MIELVVALTVLVPLAVALLWPSSLPIIAILSGILPLTFGQEGMMVTEFGRMDLYAIRLLGLWLASLVVMVPRLEEALHYGWRFRWYLGFLTFATVALAWAPSLAYGARMVVKLTAPFLFCVVILLVTSTPHELSRLKRAMVVSGLLTVTIAVGAVLTGHSTVNAQLGLGVPGLGPAATSANLAIIALLALAMLRAAPGSGILVIFGLLVAGAIAGFTRITVVGLLLGLAAVLWLMSKGAIRWVIPLGGFVSVATLFAWSETFRQRMFKDGQVVSLDLIASDPTAALDHIHGSGRFEAWEHVLTTFFQPSPLLGSGVGTTQHYLYTHATGLNVIHSEYVRLLAEVGLLGVGLFALAVGVLMIRLVQSYRESSSDETRVYSVAALGALVLYLVFMATDNAIDYVTSCGIFVFGLIAMSEKARELEAQALAPAPSRDEARGNSVLSIRAVSSRQIGERRFPIVSCPPHRV